MADIELVVKMPEEAYRLLQTEGVDWLGAEHILSAVANGKPLDSMLDEIRTGIEEIRRRKRCWCSDCLDIIDKYKTPHWIERRLSMGIHDWTCSVCKCQYEEPTKICPNCGANTEGRYVLDEAVDDN